MSLSTQLVRLSDIKKTNSALRLHSPAQRKKARRLFERQGIVAPIILDERFNIIDGRLRFETSQIREATNCIVEMNNRGLNAYAVVHPVLRQTPVSAKDADIKRAFFAYVDADEKGAADRVRESKLFIPEMEVVTGTKPFLRNHIYFRFDEPMTDMLRWSELQKCLIKEFGTDTAIHNPSRLMRIAGSVAYPSASKLKRHYRAEVTKLLMGGKYVE